MSATEEPDPTELSRFALAVLTMRQNTPGGEWLQGDFEKYYLEGWRDLSARHGDDTDEFLFLDAINMSSALIDLLVASTGKPADYFLEFLRRSYIEPQEGL